SPYPQDRTVVVLTDDGSLSTAPIAANFSGEVYVYVGTKTTHGHPVEQAGLTNGTLSGIVQRAAMARAIRSGVMGSSVRRTPPPNWGGVLSPGSGFSSSRASWPAKAGACCVKAGLATPSTGGTFDI